MKRNMDLIRAILLEVEKLPSTGVAMAFPAIDADPQEVAYHVCLAIEGELLQGRWDETLDPSEGMDFLVQRLTPTGHDFLDAARSEFIWDHAMNEIREKGLASASIKVVKKLLDRELRKRFGFESE